MSKKIAEMLDGLDFFTGFSYRELETVARYMAYTEVAKGDVIFNEGDPGSHMLILLEGRVAIYKTGDSGAHLLSYESKGRIIGEMALLDRELRSATCVADQVCLTVTITQEALDRMARDAPAVAYLFMQRLARLLSRRLRRTSGILAEHLVQ